MIDLTNMPIHMKEILFIIINSCSEADKAEVFRIAGVFGIRVADYGKNQVLLECVKTEAISIKKR